MNHRLGLQSGFGHAVAELETVVSVDMPPTPLIPQVSPPLLFFFIIIFLRYVLDIACKSVCEWD